MVLLILGAWGWFWWIGRHDGQINFLTARGPAQWILYPKPPDGKLHKSAELSAEFARTFALDAVPEHAWLTVCAMKRCEVTINGASTNISINNENWKQPAQFEVSRQLQPGSNKISVTVFNSLGPPALCLTLDAGSLKLSTDRDWEASLAGAAWRKARLAPEPVRFEPGNGLFGGENTMKSLLGRLPMLLIFALFSAGLIVRGGWWLGRYQTRGEPYGSIHSPAFAAVAVIVVAIFWLVLFGNNLGLLADTAGFDARGHLAYIDHIRTHGSLPMADEGWQMYQAPLYYLISSVIVSPLQSSTFGDMAVHLLRFFGLLVALAQLSLILLSLRLLFPRQLGRQLFGFLLAAVLPENLYLFHYVTNESLAAVWVTGAIYLCLRVVKEDRESWRSSIGIGLCLGAALLTKVTAVLAVPFIFGALILWLAMKRRHDARAWIRTLGAVALATVAVCGWHYVRVWKHLGNPLVGNWDAASGFNWWMEDGFRTGSYYLNFGECLVHPLFSGFQGFADGVYSTLW